MYSKSFLIESLTKGLNGANVAHGIANIDTVFIDMSNSFFTDGVFTTPVSFNIGITGAGALKTEYTTQVTGVSNETISYRLGASSTVSKLFITLKYTKTTD